MKEVYLGIAIGIVTFAYFMNVNLLPIIMVGGLLYLLYNFITNQGLLRTNSIGTLVRVPQEDFSSIGGQNTAISELKEALDFILDSDKIEKMGIRPLKGLLLTGPPGTGKTLLAKAAANYTDSVFIATSGSEFIEVYAGVGAQRVRKLFQSARDKAKAEKKRSAIIFIDEIDILGAKRGTHESHMEYDQTLNQLLVEMDGINVNDEVKILVLAATNRPDMLDPALLRPGRFDRQVRVDLPDKDGRLQILKIHVKNKPLAEDVDLEAIARETFGFSGAHLESLTNEAAIIAMRNNSDKITQKDFLQAIDKVIMGEKIDRKPTPEELYRIAVHEAGHAIVSELVEKGSVANLTIVPRGNAMGFLRQAPKEDKYIYTREQLEKQIMICLAGSVAEKVIIGNKSTGASNDFEKAVELAKEIIFSGLSSLGIISKDDISPKKINDEVTKIIGALEKKTTELLTDNHFVIHKVVNVLKEKETISGEELRSILYGV